MEENVASFLALLQESITNHSMDSASIASDIAGLLLNASNSQIYGKLIVATQGIAFNMLFRSTNSIVIFFKKTQGLTDFSQAKVVLFDMLAQLLRKDTLFRLPNEYLAELIVISHLIFRSFALHLFYWRKMQKLERHLLSLYSPF